MPDGPAGLGKDHYKEKRRLSRTIFWIIHTVVAPTLSDRRGPLPNVPFSRPIRRHIPAIAILKLSLSEVTEEALAWTTEHSGS